MTLQNEEVMLKNTKKIESLLNKLNRLVHVRNFTEKSYLYYI